MNDFRMKRVKFHSTNQKDIISGIIYVPIGIPKGILQISHGMCEHMERYQLFMKYMVKQGFIVAGHDHLGHGDTSKKKDYGYFGKKDGYLYLIEDLYQMTIIVKKKYGNLPYFLIGHSMGSFIARLYLSKYAKELDGVIICGTGGRKAISKIGIKVSNMICHRKGDYYRSMIFSRIIFGTFNRKFRPIRTSKDWLTRNSAVVNRYLHDKKSMFVFTAAGLRDLITLSTLANSPKWYQSLDRNLPMFIISGSMDPVGNYGKGVKEVYGKLKSAGIRHVSMILYPGARHEILNEINYKQVYKDITNWIFKQIKQS